MTGYEYDRRMIAPCDLSLQIETIDIRQFDVKDKTGSDIRLTPPKFGSGGGSCFPSIVVVAPGDPATPVTC